MIRRITHVEHEGRVRLRRPDPLDPSEPLNRGRPAQGKTAPLQWLVQPIWAKS